jgi:iron uptake system component EfeO
MAALPALFPLALLAPSCASDNDLVLADAAHDASASAGAKQLLLARAQALHAAAQALQAEAPATAWSAATTPGAVAAMRASWKQAHAAYQGLEGITDLDFSSLDAVLDTRYDDALAAGADADLFDGQGFVGLHAVERILWSDSIPADVTAFESGLPGYVAAAFPATDAQAAEMQTALLGRLVSDTAALEAAVAALALDSPTAYHATFDLVKAQVAKVEEAGAGKDESRYAGATLADMRANVIAAQATHAVFHDWLLSKKGGAAVDAEISAGFSRLQAAYAAVQGDGLPPVPAGWSSVAPTADMLATPFGALFQATGAESDATADGSLAHAMQEAVDLLGISPAAPDGGDDAGRPPSDPT